MEKYLEQAFTKSRADSSLFSSVFYGPKGIGKRTAIQNILLNCSEPDMGERIRARKSPDILEFCGGEGIQEYRERIPAFNTGPKELAHKWLLLHDLDFCSGDICHFLLKTIEEKRTFHVLASATYLEGIPPALLSRLHPYKFYALSKARLSEILVLNKDKKLLVREQDKHPFRTVFEVEVYFTYEFEDLFASLFLKIKEASEFLTRIESWLKKVRDLCISERYACVLFLLEFIVYKMSKTAEYAKPDYQFYLSKILKSSDLLFRQPPNRTLWGINLEHQMKSFLVSLFLLRHCI